MNSVYPHFNNEKNLWNKNIEEINANYNILEKEKLKVKINSEKFCKKAFILTENYLFLKNNKNNIKSFINWNYIGLSWNRHEMKLTLFNDTKFFETFFEYIDVFNKWKKIILKRSVLNSLREKFNFKSLIFKGDSLIYWIQKIKNEKNYITKVFLKNDQENKKSIFNEINMINSLKHSNIINIKYLYEDKNYYYIIFKYCNHKNLKEYLTKEHTYSDKISIVNQILKGIKYMHSLKIVHRDIKPENIFLHKNSYNKLNVKIGDFGVANHLQKEFIYKRCGTPGYIAPEIMNYRSREVYKITSQVDIYSLGHMLYNIFTNKFMFNYENLKELINLNKNNKHNISYIKDDSLKRIISRCLKTNPEERISIDDLIDYFKK